MINENILILEKYLEYIVTTKNLSKNTCLSYKSDILEFIKLIGKKKNS